MNRIDWLLRRARQILRTEGLIPLVRQGFPFVAGPFFRYQTYYLYEHTPRNIRILNETDFMPKIDNFNLKIVSTNEEADGLEAEGLEFRSQTVNARESLDKGAVAFCIFVGPELAHTGWVAMTEEAKKYVDPSPYRVDFGNDQACTGSAWTVEKYRGKGLMAYGYCKRLQYLLEKGVRTSRNAINTSNIASQKVHAKFNPEIYARARYLKILWWKSWKEKPLETSLQRPRISSPH